MLWDSSHGRLLRLEVEELASALQREDTRLDGSAMLRGFIEAIVSTPEKGQPPARWTIRSGEPTLRTALREVWPRC
jgi:hypothetical protein